jgi:hypothetical protein
MSLLKLQKDPPLDDFDTERLIQLWIIYTSWNQYSFQDLASELRKYVILLTVQLAQKNLHQLQHD